MKFGLFHFVCVLRVKHLKKKIIFFFVLISKVKIPFLICRTGPIDRCSVMWLTYYYTITYSNYDSSNVERNGPFHFSFEGRLLIKILNPTSTRKWWETSSSSPNLFVKDPSFFVLFIERSPFWNVHDNVTPTRNKNVPLQSAKGFKLG